MKAGFRAPLRSAASLALWLLVASGCAGDGCSCASSIPGGFPLEERTPNMVQLRVSDTGLAALEADPGALLGGLLGEGGLAIDVPQACGADDNPKTCCDDQGNPTDACGPVEIDLAEMPGDAPRLEVNPVQGAARIDVVVRARVRTGQPIPIVYDLDWLTVDCDVAIDTAGGDDPDLLIRADVGFVQNEVTGTTELDVGEVAIEQLTGEDVTLSGNFGCDLANLGVGLFIDTLSGTFEDVIRDTLTSQVCKKCPGGTVDECGPAADSCSDGGVCMQGDACVQELGIAGRLQAGAVLGSLSPGTLGALDLYEVAGGYATTDGGGLSLGFLGGMLPGGAPGDRCGPGATPPADVTIEPSSFFTGNTRPDTGDAFDFAVGIHQHNLDQAAWAAYEGGFLCLSIGTRAVDLINSETLAVLMPSLGDLMHGDAGQIVLGLRPQAPPSIQLGAGTTDDAGDILEPLLDIAFRDLDIDIFAMVDEQWIRTMTLTTDLRLPLNLDVAEGQIVPVLGDLEGAFSNIRVSNSEALAEPADELAAKFPALLSLALPLLADGLGGFDLPAIGGLSLSVAPGGITTVEDKAFLAIFGTFDLAGESARVDTRADVTGFEIPDTAAFRAPRWDRARAPRLRLSLGGVGEGPLEWSHRVDGGLWSPYSKNPELALQPLSFWLQGRHRVEIRARVVGAPETTDPTPVILEPIIDTIAPTALFSRVDDGALLVMGTDNVSRGERLRLRYRIAGGAWTDTRAPARIALNDARPDDVEVVLVDEAGNSVTHLGPAGQPIIGFHGTAGEGGCECSSGGASRTGVLAALLVLLLACRPRHALTRLARAAVRMAPLALVVVSAAASSLLAGCSCSGGETDCDGEQCEVGFGPVGRYAAIAADGDRILLSAYDEGLGDLVLVDASGEDLQFTAIDGVPAEEPVFPTSSYRGGIKGAGANVGAWTDIAFSGGKAMIAYQDLDNGALRFALETEDGWVTHEIEGGDGSVGVHTALAVRADGRPVVAYLAVGVDGESGEQRTELRVARAMSPAPQGPTAWEIAVADAAPISCAGLCAPGSACVDDGGPRCLATSTDCGDCGDSESCIAGTCTARIEPLGSYDLAEGTGLFVDIGELADGRLVLVHYDRVGTALVLQVEDGAGGWTREVLDDDTSADTGMFATMALEGDTVHIAYQDALADRLLYTTWNGTRGAVEVVDDGARSGDRNHPVGAGARLVVAGGQPLVLYQDGATSDLVSARRTGDGWTREDLLTGPTLDGFFIDAVVRGDGVWVSTYRYDRSYYPPGELVIATIP